MLDEILFARFRADAALAAARLVAIDVHRRALDVARMADGDGHVHVGDQVFDLDLLDGVDDLRAPVVAVIFLDFAQLADDHLLQLLFAGQNFLQLGDQRADLGQFLQDFVDGELRQPVQLQFEDGVDLGVAEADATSSARPYFLRSSLTPLSVSAHSPALDDRDVLFSKYSCKFSRRFARLENRG